MARRSSLRTLIVTALAVAVVAPAAPAAAAPPSVKPFGAYADDPAGYEGQAFCTNQAQPGVVAFRDLVRKAYPGTGDSGIVRGCNVGGKSEHKEGRAWDWGVNAANAKQKQQADELLAWLLATDAHGNRHAMARRFGISYIIWNRRIWHAGNGEWRPYSGASPHTDHVHFTFSWLGASRHTTFWTRATGPTPTFRWTASSNLTGTPTTPVFWGGSTPGKAVVPLVGDWDRNGKDEPGAFRDGTWTLRSAHSHSATSTTFTYGRPGDEPLVGDWDGDGRDTPMVRRGSRWYGRNTLASGRTTITLTFGEAGGTALAGDFDGDGRDEVAIWRDGRLQVLTRLATGAPEARYGFGQAGDRPVVGDWNGDRIDTVGVVRGDRWLMRGRPGGGRPHHELTFGRTGDLPLAGDTTGSGKDRPITARP